LKWQPPSSRHSRPTISDKEKRTAKGYDVSFELYARDCRERERELTQKHVSIDKQGGTSSALGPLCVIFFVIGVIITSTTEHFELTLSR
jgi:hypothetical protein